MTLTAQDYDEIKKLAAKEIADRFFDETLNSLGFVIGDEFALDINLASRLSGWNEKWIRNNLEIIKCEGHRDHILLRTLKEARELRKTKKGGKKF